MFTEYYDYDAWEREQDSYERREAYEDYLAERADLEAMDIED